MADNTENIGGVSVSITGDYSQLAGDFDAAVALAVSKGATLAEAIKSAMAVPDTAPLTQAFGVVGDAAVSAAGQLDLFDKAAHVDYSDAAGQLNLFAIEMESMGPTAAQAATGIMQIPVALGEAGDKAHETEGIIREFGEKVSEILEHPVQQFRALVEAIGPVGVAMGTLGAIVYELGKNITELVLEEGQAARNTENFAEKLGLSFEEAKKLSEMAQVVSVDIGSLTRVSTLLAQALEDPDGSPKARKTADALKEMGIAAETGGQAMLGLLQHLAGISDATERLAEAARIIPARTVANLQPLLANFDELSKAIEALGGQLDESMVKNLLEANKESKLLGIAWDHVKEAMAATFAPTVTDGLKLLTQLMTGAPSGTLEDQIKRVTAEINSLTESALAGTVAVSGMMGGGFTALGAGGDPAKLEQLQKQLDELRFRRIKEQMPPEAGGAGTSATAPDFSAANYAAYAQLGVTNYSGLTQGTTDESGLTTKFSDLQAFNALIAQSSLGMDRTMQAADTLFAKLSAAFDAGAISAGTFNAAIDKINTAVSNSVLNDFTDNFTKWASLPPFDPFKGVDLSGDTTKLHQAANAIELIKAEAKGIDPTALNALDKAAQQAGANAIIAAGAFAAVEKAAEVVNVGMEKVSLEMPKWYKPLEDAEKRFTDSAIIDQEKLLKQYHIRSEESLATTLADNAKIQASNSFTATEKLRMQQITDKQILVDAQQYRLMQEDVLRTDIAIAAERGTDATAYIIKLTQMQYETKALADRSNELGKVYVDVRAAFNNAFGDLSKGLADAAINGKNLGDVFENVGKRIATSILDTIIAGALKPLQAELNKTGGLFDTVGKAISGGLGKVIPGLGGGGGSLGANSLPIDPSNLSSRASGYTSDLGTPGVNGQPGVDLGAPSGGSPSPSGGGGSSLLGSLGGAVPLVGAIGSVASAVSSIIANFQFSHMNKLLGEIEVTTRKMEAAIGGNGSESIFGYTKLTWQATQVMIEELAQLHSDFVVLGFTSGLGGATSGGPDGINAFQIVDLVSGLQSGRLQNYTTPVANPLYPGGQPSLDTSAASAALDDLATKATAAGTTLAAFGATTGTAETNTEAQARITATLTKAQQAQLGLVGETMTAALDQAHALLESGDAAKFTALQLFALGRESASLGTSETATELAQRQIINAMAAAQANWNGGRPQVAPVTGGVPQPGFLQGDTTFASSVESGAAQGVSTGTLMAGVGYSGGSLYQPSPGESGVDFYAGRSWVRTPDGGYDLVSNKGFPTIHIGLGLPNSPSPTAPNLVPGTPTTNYNSGGNPMVTVNALNPSSRGVADGIINSLRSLGVKI